MSKDKDKQQITAELNSIANLVHGSRKSDAKRIQTPDREPIADLYQGGDLERKEIALPPRGDNANLGSRNFGKLDERESDHGLGRDDDNLRIITGLDRLLNSEEAEQFGRTTASLDGLTYNAGRIGTSGGTTTIQSGPIKQVFAARPLPFTPIEEA